MAASSGEEGGFLDEGDDSSLQGKALQRARDEKLPTTLTAFEWEEWYEEHGVPEEHRPEEEKVSKSLWKRVRDWLSRGREKEKG